MDKVGETNIATCRTVNAHISSSTYSSSESIHNVFDEKLIIAPEWYKSWYDMIYNNLIFPVYILYTYKI